MAVDINSGDLLVIGSDEHKVVGVETLTRATSASSFERRATVAASTRRYTVDGTTGKRTTSTPESSLSIWPLMSVDSQVRDQFPEIASPATVQQTMVRDSAEIVRLYIEVTP